MGLIALLAGAAYAGEPAAAPLVEQCRAAPAVPEVSLEAPVSAEARLAIARELAADPATHEEALGALVALALEPATARRAHLALVDLCLRADARPGWLDVYARLATDARTTPAEAAALDLRAAEARTWVPDEHARARDLLLAEAARRGAAGLAGDPELAFHLARAHLVLGDIDAAEGVLALRLGDPRFAVAARAAALGRPTARASLPERIRAIAALGYVDLALRLAPTEDPAYGDPAAWAAHAEVLLARGRPAEAHVGLGAALAWHPDDPALAMARARTFLATGDLAGAWVTAQGVEAAERWVRAAMLARESPEEAFALAPAEPIVRRALAEVRLREGRAGEALALLAPLVAAGPPDAALLDRHAEAANAAGRSEVGVGAWRAAVTRASGPHARAALVEGLVDALARAAEARKRGPGGAAAAVALYRMAVTTRPSSAGTWAGLGGALWEAGALAGAQAAYAHAVGVARAEQPGRAQPWVADWATSAAEIAMLRGNPADARGLLAPYAGRYPAVAARLALAESALAGARPPIATLEWLVGEHPDDAALVAIVAGVLADAGRPEAALDAWLALARLRPADARARVGAGRALAALGRYEEAVVMVAEGGPDLAAGRAEILRARGERRWRVDRDLPGALADFSAALDAAPDVWTWSAVGGLYLSNGQARPALAAFRAARTLAPTNTLAAAGEIRALAALGRLPPAPDAVRALRDPEGIVAAALDEAHETVVVGRARLLLALGEIEGARAVIDGLGARVNAAGANRGPVTAGPGTAGVAGAAASAGDPLRAGVVGAAAATDPARAGVVGAAAASGEPPRAVATSRPPKGAAALSAALDLAEGEPAAAWTGARVALAADPTDAHAAQVLVDAAVELGQLDAAVAFLEGLAEARPGGGRAEWLAVELAGARLLAARGDTARARARVEAVEVAVTTPDDLALVGGTWLALGEVEAARAALGRALARAPDHAASLVALAATETATGRRHAARVLLEDAWARTDDPLVGAALVDARTRAGAVASASGLREALRGAIPGVAVSGPPLPVLAALQTGGVGDRATRERADASVAGDARRGAAGAGDAPRGAAARTGPVVAPDDCEHAAALGDGALAEETWSPEAGISTQAGRPARWPTLHLARPVVDAGGGLLARSGTPGANQLLATMGTVSVVQPVGPVEVTAAALLVGVYDGLDDRSGAAGAIGVSAPPEARYVLTGTLGSSAVGVSDAPYLTWHAAVGWRIGRGEIGLDTGRVPVTDSLASWGGQGSWGRATSTWAGAWLAWAAEGTDVGARGRMGSVDALDAATGRRQLDLWAGRRLGTAVRSVRVGVRGTLLGHDVQLDGFGPAEAGAFTPLGYGAGAGVVDGVWGLGRGARLCGGLHVGAQDVRGEGSAFLGEGTFVAAGVRAGGTLRLGGRWSAGVAARWDVVGRTWSEQAGSAWLRWGEAHGGAHTAPSPVFGSAVEGLTTCDVP